MWGGNREFPRAASIQIQPIWEFLKIRGNFLGVPILRLIVFGGLYWGPLFWETTISRPKVCNWIPEVRQTPGNSKGAPDQR